MLRVLASLENLAVSCQVLIAQALTGTAGGGGFSGRANGARRDDGLIGRSLNIARGPHRSVFPLESPKCPRCMSSIGGGSLYRGLHH